MRLTIVIPALNEEHAIASIIERSLAARDHIVAHSPVDEVEIIVVSDGSTDRTAQIAASYGEVELIEFPINRGYGAAIKEGFRCGTGELVSFLDADGTCDPRFFATLCRELIEEDAAVALGSRLGRDSDMPGVRRLGNRIYAIILSALSNRVVTDTASGMRVIRRDVLEQLYPLPDGLNFTPAMSARVLCDERLGIVECPMRYAERIGESKLHVVRDGVRFLRTIFEMTLMWQPAKVFTISAVACLACMTMLAAHPIESWLRVGQLQEDTIYRLLFCSLLGSLGVLALSAGVVSDNLHRLWSERPPARTFFATLIDRVYTLGAAGVMTILAVPILLWLVGPGMWTRVFDGYVAIHWSRVVLAGLIVFSLAQIAITTLIVNLIRFHTERRSIRSIGDAATIKEAVASATAIRSDRVGVPKATPRSTADSRGILRA